MDRRSRKRNNNIGKDRNSNMANNAKDLLTGAKMFLIGASVFLASCNKFEDIEKYQRPEWLVGKVYTQIEASPELSMFAQLIAEAGYDSILDKTGTYTVFAPTNEAFESYLAENGLGSIQNITAKEKEELVKFHVIQMPWNRDQLQGLSSKGWISADDLTNDKPFAFKRQTILKNNNRSYPVKVEREGQNIYATIVPEEDSDENRVVYSNSRKYAPIYFDDFLSVAQLTGGDYSFYFNRNYEPGNIYFLDGKVVGEDIYADNGFVYMIDRVTDPLLNAEELMDAGIGSESYSEFKYLIYLNSDFSSNDEATMAQEGADQGLEVDQLYDLTYPGLGFDIHQELTVNPELSNATSLTIEYHNGCIAPTNTAFREFADNIMTGPGRWPNMDGIPANIKRLVVNSHMSGKPIYQQEVSNGFINANGDFITIDPSSIIQKSFGSNATFIGVNKVITPKAFSGVSAPLYLIPDFQKFLATMEYSGLLPALKQEDLSYSLFIMTDKTLIIDESLIIDWLDWKKERFRIRALDRSEDPAKYVTRSKSDIYATMNAQIAIEPLMGVARLEFLETLDGRHLVINNSDHTLTGGVSSQFGYNNSDSAITVNYNEIEGDFFNGKVYETDGWLRFIKSDLHSQLSGSKFLDLLIKAKMATLYDMLFTNPADRFTVFLPSAEALEAVQADTLSGDELKNFMKLHFIKDELIFTDGRKPQGLYTTMSRVLTGNAYHYQQLNLSPGINEISLLNDQGEVYYQIVETPGVSNIICAQKNKNHETDQSGEDESVYFTEAVIHKIDTVLIAY